MAYADAATQANSWDEETKQGFHIYSFVTLSWDAGVQNCSDNTLHANQSNSSHRSSLHPRL